MARTVLLPVDDNQGYAPDQIETAVTLQDMLEAVQQAIQEFGADAKVVVSNGQRYGAGFGRLQAFGREVPITDANPEDEEGDDYYNYN